MRSLRRRYRKKLLHVLPVSGCHNGWYLCAARANLLFGVRTTAWVSASNDRKRRFSHVTRQFSFTVVRRFKEHAPRRSGSLVAIKTPRDLGLRELVVAIQRPHQPALLELGEPAVVVQLCEPNLGLDAVDDVGDRDRHGRPAQRARRTFR